MKQDESEADPPGIWTTELRGEWELKVSYKNTVFRGSFAGAARRNRQEFQPVRLIHFVVLGAFSRPRGYAFVADIA